MKCLIVDSNYVCHSVYHTMPKLTFKSKDTSVIFGFIKRIISFVNQFPDRKIVFVWDSVYSIRKEIYPEYKKLRANRYQNMTDEEKRDRERAHKQFSEIREVMLPMLGFKHIYEQEGYEADDLMASIKENNPDYNIVIVTTDQDIYQLIDNRCMLFNPAAKTMHTVTTFADKYGCHPALWGEAKAIAGCSTDNVKGVQGVAEKTAIKYLTKKLKHSSKKFKDIENNKDIIEFNREIVILPMQGTKPISISENNCTDRHKFVKMCEKYNFMSLINSSYLDKWDRIAC